MKDPQTRRKAWLTLGLSRLRPGQIARLIEQLGSPEAVVRRLKLQACDPEGPFPALTPGDSEYPIRLLDLHDPPALLYRNGLAVPEGRHPRVAIVGSRRATAYGRTLAYRLGADLARRGVVVVSGLALGIDSAAHEGAMTGFRSGAHPLAVLGCGLDCDYPRTNRQLRTRMAGQACLLSEYPAGTSPAAWRFPARNRIVAGLAQVVVVVEAGLRSGALITTDLATELGRTVMAAPGQVGNPNSEGTHKLLFEGAPIVRGVDDILAQLGDFTAPAWQPVELEEPLAQIYQALDPGGSSMAELSARTGLDGPALARGIVHLELKGLVLRHLGGLYTPV
ncbi:MAG: DNA-processing protein DprA [Candidatus Eremiobacteraeota bacterium]|nr:DNA-processing protein DprA [Candidatus Eremiobacteraeota bacterium]